MSKKKKALRAFVWIMALLVLFPASCSVLFQSMEQSVKEEVGAAIPSNFPILVLTLEKGEQTYRVDTVYHKDLEEFIESYPEYTYLVPAGQEDYLNQQLLQSSRSRKEPPDFDSASPDPWAASFRVERLPDGKQYLEVEATWDDDQRNKGWYEATEKQIFPKYYQSYSGPGFAMGAFTTTFLFWAIGLTIYGVVRAIYRRLSKGKSTVIP